jgi:hypothetical protein
VNGRANHSAAGTGVIAPGQLEPANVQPTTATVTRSTDDDLEAVAAVTLVLNGLDRPAQRRVAAFVARKWGSADE